HSGGPRASARSGPCPRPAHWHRHHAGGRRPAPWFAGAHRRSLATIASSNPSRQAHRPTTALSQLPVHVILPRAAQARHGLTSRDVPCAPVLTRGGGSRGRNDRSYGNGPWHRRLLELPALALHLLAPSCLIEPSQPLQLLHVALHASHGKLA